MSRQKVSTRHTTVSRSLVNDIRQTISSATSATMVKRKTTPSTPEKMANARRIQPERNMKVLTIDNVKCRKFQAVLLPNGTKSGADREWKSCGKVNISIMKNQKGRYSFEARNTITKRQISNHSLSKDIVLSSHVTDEDKTIMWKVDYDIAKSQDDELTPSIDGSTILLIFDTKEDATKFKSTFLECQSKMK